MEVVQRAVLGGIFLKARDPKKLADWYRQNLGIPLEEGQTYASFLSERGGRNDVLVHLPGRHQVFRHAFALHGELSSARARRHAGPTASGGRQVDEKVEDYDYGRFAWATDPEGNRFELWQPKSAPA